MTTTNVERRVVNVHDPVVVNQTPVHLAKEAITPGLWEEHDPFLLMMEDRFGEGAFGLHPHRGLETITYIIGGRLEHNDNRGGNGMLGARDVQLMTAAKGVIHNEVPPEGSTVHLLQLWLNMPAAAKLTEPRYQDLRHAEMPSVTVDGANITVYSGTSHDIRSYTLNHVPFTLVEVDLQPGATVSQDLPGSYNGFVHIIKGQGHVGADRTSAADGQTLWLDRTDTTSDTAVTITAETAMRVLIAAGEPLHEPVVAAGPFVMNTEQEIADAYARQHGTCEPQASRMRIAGSRGATRSGNRAGACGVNFPLVKERSSGARCARRPSALAPWSSWVPGGTAGP